MRVLAHAENRRDVMEGKQEKLSTVSDLVNRFKVSEKTVRRWIASGQIENIRLGRQLRFEEREIKRFLDLRRRQANRKKAS
jgi:excisionase family DNA binding protein